MNNHPLLDSEDKIVTKMGRSFLSERVVFRGKDLHHQLHDLSWIELYAFGITGRHYSESEVKLLNYIWLSTSYPDKSIWPNHITAIAGNFNTTPGLAISAGIAACEATIFGGKPFRTGIDFFQRCRVHMQSSCRLEEDGLEDDKLEDFVQQEMTQHKVIYGYGRPLASSDERVPHLLKFLEDLTLTDTSHLEIAISVANLLKKQKGLNMNVAALYAALGADLGFNPKTFHTFMTLCFVAGMPPGYLEGSEQQEGTFLPVRCERLKYTGIGKRDW